jgi:hypothetical protein
VGHAVPFLPASIYCYCNIHWNHHSLQYNQVTVYAKQKYIFITLWYYINIKSSISSDIP